jgi:hypothetical protein
MLDERELRFRREAPLLGWRLFRVRRLSDGYVLCAPMIHSPAPPPWRPGLTIAHCLKHDHGAPAPGCRWVSTRRSKERLTRSLAICATRLTTATLGPTPKSLVAVESSWTRVAYAARRPSWSRSPLSRIPSRVRASVLVLVTIWSRAMAFGSGQVPLRPAGSRPTCALTANPSRVRASTYPSCSTTCRSNRRDFAAQRSRKHQRRALD